MHHCVNIHFFFFRYDQSELRMSLVSRYQCFRSVEERTRFHAKDEKKDARDMLAQLKTVSV